MSLLSGLARVQRLVAAGDFGETWAGKADELYAIVEGATAGERLEAKEWVEEGGGRRVAAPGAGWPLLPTAAVCFDALQPARHV